MNLTVAIIVIVALLVGALLGWLIGSRASATANERASRAAELQKLLDAVIVERDEAMRNGRTIAEEAASLRPVASRVASLETQLSDLRLEKDELAAAKAGFERGEVERREAHDAQLRQIMELEAKFEARFGDIAGKAVETAHDAFLKRAGERMSHEGKENEAKLKALLGPVESTLKRYEEGLLRVEKEREGSYRELQQAVSQLAQGNDQVRKETQRLANVMGSSPKARGRWGEEQLQNILESAGLTENVDFNLQSTITDGERNLRPDCVISLPGDRTIVIDVKCPLVAFEQAFDEEDEVKRGVLLKQHAAALGSYAADLGKKSYWRQFEKSPDFVIMYVPGEHFLSAAAEKAPAMIEIAARNGVIIASTINMLALAKIMAGMWRQESLNVQAQELGRVGRELHSRISVLTGHISRLGNNLDKASQHYNAMVGSLERNVLTSARRFEELGAGSGKSIDSPALIETTTVPLTKLALLPVANEEDAA